MKVFKRIDSARRAALATLLTFLTIGCGMVAASTNDGGDEKPINRHYVTAPPSPQSQTQEMVDAKSLGCKSCHTQSDQATMHMNPAVKLGCTDCHGGNASIALTAGVPRTSPQYQSMMDLAHVLPRYPKAWHYPSSAKPARTYTLLNREAPEFVRFMNPSDYRVASEACGACHKDVIEASRRSLHATNAMFWGGAAYNNGILDAKNYILGESYDRNSVGTLLKGPNILDPKVAFDAAILPQLYPLPAWETVKPADVFRIFERGGRNISNLFPETG